MSNTKIPSVLWSADQAGTISSADKAIARENIGLTNAVVLKGDATVAQLNGTVDGLTAGWQYTLTDAGTLDAGSIPVTAGDKVVWNGSAWEAAWVVTKANDTAIAPEYSSTSTYLHNALCMYRGSLYYCSADDGITTPEEWTPQHWTLTELTTQVSLPNLFIFQANQGYEWPDGETVVSAINNNTNDVIIVFHLGRGEKSYFRYWNYYPTGQYPRWTFVNTLDPNDIIELEKITDIQTGNVSYRWTTRQYVRFPIIWNLASQWNKDSTYIPGNITYNGTGFYRCTQPVGPEDYQSFPAWKVANLEDMLKSRVSIIHAEYDESGNITTMPSRTEMENIDVTGTVILDLKIYTGPYNPDTEQWAGPHIHQKYVLMDYTIGGTDSTYRGPWVYYFVLPYHTGQHNNSNGMQPSWITVTWDPNGSADPTVTSATIPSYVHYTGSIRSGSDTVWPDATNILKTHINGGLPVADVLLDGLSKNYFFARNTTGGQRELWSIPDINSRGQVVTDHLVYNSMSGAWSREGTSAGLGSNYYVDYGYMLANGPQQPNVYEKSHIIFGNNSYLWDKLYINCMLEGKMYTIHCVKAGCQLKLYNNVANTTFSVYDGSHHTQSGTTTVVSDCPYDLGNGYEIELYSSSNTRSRDVTILRLRTTLYITYGY